MNTIDRKPSDYAVVCIQEFARRKGLSPKQAYLYLLAFRGLDFLEEFYDVEHTLSLEEAIDDLTRICSQNGGGIQ